MTQQAAASSDHLIGDNPPALTNRPVRPDADASRLSRFDDDRWDLTPGIFEDHSTKTSLNFEVFPIRWRVAVKEYFWLLINDETIRPLPSAQLDKRLSLRTISFASTPLARVLAWAEEHGTTSLNELSPARLDLMLADIADLDLSKGPKGMMISETRRLWAYPSNHEFVIKRNIPRILLSRVVVALCLWGRPWGGIPRDNHRVFSLTHLY